jgi:hypothetical protein
VGQPFGKGIHHTDKSKHIFRTFEEVLHLGRATNKHLSQPSARPLRVVSVISGILFECKHYWLDWGITFKNYANYQCLSVGKSRCFSGLKQWKFSLQLWHVGQPFGKGIHHTDKSKHIFRTFEEVLHLGRATNKHLGRRQPGL